VYQQHLEVRADLEEDLSQFLNSLAVEDTTAGLLTISGLESGTRQRKLTPINSYATVSSSFGLRASENVPDDLRCTGTEFGEVLRQKP
jgi:hypothetical protein